MTDESAIDAVEDAIEDARDDATDATRWETLNARLQALEARGGSEPPDLSPIESRLTELGESVTGGLSGLTDRLAALEATRTEAKALGASTAVVDDAPSITPQIDTKATAKAHVKERTPRVSHLLFRRIGGHRS